MAFIRQLLKRLGWVHIPSPRKFALDDALHPMLDSLAEQQQRSPDEVASDMLSSALAKGDVDADLWQRWQSLSPREQQVTALTCLGDTNPQMAAKLGLSVETIRTHMRNTQFKFNVTSKADLRVLLADWDFSAWDH